MRENVANWTSTLADHANSSSFFSFSNFLWQLCLVEAACSDSLTFLLIVLIYRCPLCPRVPLSLAVLCCGCCCLWVSGVAALLLCLTLPVFVAVCLSVICCCLIVRWYKYVSMLLFL